MVAYHEKCNHYYQNKRCPIMARVNTKTIYTVRHVYLTTMTVLLMLQTQHFILRRVTVSRPIATSKQKHPVIL